jgi:type I restriction enzyme M protein
MPGLGELGLAALAKEIKHLDPDETFVSIDVVNHQVWYCDEIIAHEAIGPYVGEEEPVRAYIVAWLIRVGGYTPASIELEKRYPSGRGQIELDVRVADESGGAYALIEVKAPDSFGGASDPLIAGQLYSPAAMERGTRVLSLATIDVVTFDSIVSPLSVTIDYPSWPTHRAWVNGGRPHRDDIPLNYGEATIEPFRRGGDHDLNHNIRQPDLDRLRQRLHDRLWGGSNDDNAIYAWLVKVFLTKIHDEKVTNDGEAYACQVMHTGSRPESVTTTASRINRRWEEAYRKYIISTGPDPDSLDSAIFTASDLSWAIEMLQGISLTSAGQTQGDLLGGFFEAITRDGFKQNKGLFFTHYNLAAFMVEVLDVSGMARKYIRDPGRHINDRLPYIVDPSAGSGTFLLAAMRAITSDIERQRNLLGTNDDVRDSLTRWLPTDAPNTWAAEFLYGIEKREDLATSIKVNMVLHQDGHTHIYKDDALAPLNDIASRQQDEKFRSHVDRASGYERPSAETMDVVITNPPFSLTLDPIIISNLARTFTLSAQRNSENLFLERWYQLLRPKGRLAAVLPESFFSTAENSDARRFLFHYFHVRAVVSLPPHAFQPWTPTRTSLLFAQRKTAEEAREWGDAYNEAVKWLGLSYRSAKAALRRLQHPRASEKADDLVPARKEVGFQFDALGLGGTLSLDDGAQIEFAQQMLASVDVAQLAFARTVEKVSPDASYIGMIVNEIGYKRTKRGEASRRNDLFQAVVDVEGTSEVIRNLSLNTARGQWHMVRVDDGEDALSVLSKVALWD